MKHLLKIHYKHIMRAIDREVTEFIATADDGQYYEGMNAQLYEMLAERVDEARVFWVDMDAIVRTTGVGVFESRRGSAANRPISVPKMPFTDVVVNVPVENGNVFCLHYHETQWGQFWNTTFLRPKAAKKVPTQSIILGKYHLEKDGFSLPFMEDMNGYLKIQSQVQAASDNIFAVFDQLKVGQAETKPVTGGNREVRDGIVGDQHKFYRINLIPSDRVETGMTRDYQPRRDHEVRGHWRTYKSGKRTWIRSHRRGDETLGTIAKTYIVDAAE